MYVHDEKFRTIFCKINERPCCTARCPYPDWYWIKRGGRSIMSRALRGCWHYPRIRVCAIRWTSYNSGCPMKKQRRYPFAKHKLAPRSPNRRVCILRRSWSAFDDFASKLPRRNTDNSLSGKCFASKSGNRNGIIVAYKSDTRDNFTARA